MARKRMRSQTEWLVNLEEAGSDEVHTVVVYRLQTAMDTETGQITLRKLWVVARGYAGGGACEAYSAVMYPEADGHRLVFGPNNEKGLRLNRDKVAIEIVTIGENGVTEDDILVHDETDALLAQMLVTLDGPDAPVVVGVIYCNPVDTYDAGVARQVAKAKIAKPNADMKELLFAGSTWTVD